MSVRDWKIAIIAGEESGDLLGADLIVALKRKITGSVRLVGVGGSHLAHEGLHSFFDPDDIALMGLGAVLKKLPRLIRHIQNISRYIVSEKPDCLIVIDSPDFTHRVAKKIRSLDPSIPIIKYIAPSVWAWRPERAKAMRDFVDHVLVVLPFEVDVMRALEGPPATYVGHRLLSYPPLMHVRSVRAENAASRVDSPTLLILPGSRGVEIRGLMPLFGKAVALLKERMPNLQIILPTLPRIESEVREHAALWPVQPEITVGEDEKWVAFTKADAALAASGTVSLELALAGIPMILSYKADWFSKKYIMPKITVWSAALPNIIADEPVVPEYFNEWIRPDMLAHQIAYLLPKGAPQDAQLQGFAKVFSTMKTAVPSGELAANVVLEMLNKS